MRRMPSSARRMRTQRTRPVLESLEGRRLLSGVFSHKDREFSYITPSGGHATIKIVGRGNLAGTTVDGDGALKILYGGTNAYSKIVGQVQGGGGHAPLDSLLNSQMVQNGQGNSISGVGGNPLAAVLMKNFDLIPGGTINLTPGVTSLVLNSIGSNTHVNLRTLPPAPSYRILPPNAGNTAGGLGSLFGLASATTGSTSTVVSALSARARSLSTFQGAATPANTLEAGQTTSVTSAQGVTLNYASDGGLSQVLTGVSGSFTAQPNITVPLAPGQALTEPPAPPGIILKANSIDGAPNATVNLLTDSKIFGYDPTTGDLVRFDLNLANNTGAIDPTFTPIVVPGDPANAGVDVVKVGNQLDVLVSSGTTVYAYEAVTGAPAGSFTTTAPINSIASTATLTVLGSYQTNQLQMINLPASLQTGMEQPLGFAMPFTPASEVTLLGGVTGVAGSNNLYATIAAHFSTLQPGQYQLGLESIGTTEVITSGQGTHVFNQFSSSTGTALTQHGNKITVQPNPQTPDQVGAALGSVDSSLALVMGASKGTNTINLYVPSSSTSNGSLTLNYADLLTGLSQNFRTDLGGSALIDIQGDVQSIRGGSANGMVLNDTGNLALVKLQQIANSTIVGQPISHLQIKNRTNTTFLSSARLVDQRNGVKVQSNIQPIGPLSQNGL
jgi:lipoprotein-anchoring transpeptidase ErfK/SrfK